MKQFASLNSVFKVNLLIHKALKRGDNFRIICSVAGHYSLILNKELETKVADYQNALQ